MRKPLKVLLSILIVFGGIFAYGIIAVGVVGPERLATSGVPGTVVLLIVAAGCGVGLWSIWRVPRGGRHG